jgi:hypothetical protein
MVDQLSWADKSFFAGGISGEAIRITRIWELISRLAVRKTRSWLQASLYSVARRKTSNGILIFVEYKAFYFAGSWLHIIF